MRRRVVPADVARGAQLCEQLRLQPRRLTEYRRRLWPKRNRSAAHPR